MTFKEKIVKLRKMKGLTQDDFASAVGVSRQAVYKWESGQSYPEVAKLIEIKMLLGISIDDLLDESYEVVVPEKKKRRRLSKEAQVQIEQDVLRELGEEVPAVAAVAEETVEETPAAEEVAPVEETPVTEEVVEDEPVVEEVVEEVAAEEVVEETPAAEEVVQETPVAEEVVEETPAVEETPVEETPVAEDTPKGKKKSREDAFLEKVAPEKRGLFSRLFGRK